LISGAPWWPRRNHRRPTKPPHNTYIDAVAEIAAAKPMASLIAIRPFDVIRDNLAVALVRPMGGNPRQIEVIDCLTMDGPAFQRSVIRLARLRREIGRLAGMR
jgi:hypothetical protein